MRRCAPASAHATGEYVLIQDADLEYDPEDWPRLLVPVLRGRARVVYGSRFTGERRNMLFLHWIGNRFLSLTTNVLYNTTLSDMETCYKLIDRQLLDSIELQGRSFRHRARDHGQDPEARDAHLRGADLVHGTRVRRGQEDHVARRLRGACGRWSSIASVTDAPSPPAGPQLSSTTKQGRCSLDCVRSILADDERRSGRSRRRGQRFARRFGRRGSRGRYRTFAS